MYEYTVFVKAVYDGDTVTVDIDLGFNSKLCNEKLRLLGINAPEIRGGTDETRQKAREARDFLRSLILNKHVTVRTVKDQKGKYGRYLAIIYLPDGQCVNLSMIENNHAEKYIGFEELEHIYF